MRQVVLLSLALLVPAVTAPHAAQAPLPLGAGRPDVPGITRTTLKDDAKSTVTRVHFAPGAFEPPHTHATDVILVPVIAGTIELTVGSRTISEVKAGDVQFVPHDVTHHLRNTGKQPFELIAIAVK